MTIRKGENWGTYVEPPDELIKVNDDLAAANFLTSHFGSSTSVVNLAIGESQIGRTLGVKGAEFRHDKMLLTPFDVVEVTYTPSNRPAKQGGSQVERRFFMGFSLIRRRFWLGGATMILNSSFINGRNFAPRAHPNDGKFDVIELDESMKIRQKFAAFKLAKSGSHLPHPKIRYIQAPEHSVDLDRPCELVIEGQNFGSVDRCVFRVIPDSVNLYW